MGKLSMSGAWPLMPLVCRVDLDLIEYWELQGLSPKSGLHMGPGQHNSVVKYQSQKNPSSVFDIITNSSEEFELIKDASKTHIYYLLNIEDFMPGRKYDHISLFHLNEMPLKKDLSEILEGFISALEVEGRMMFYRYGRGFSDIHDFMKLKSNFKEETFLGLSIYQRMT